MFSKSCSRALIVQCSWLHCYTGQVFQFSAGTYASCCRGFWPRRPDPGIHIAALGLLQCTMYRWASDVIISFLFVQAFCRYCNTSPWPTMLTIIKRSTSAVNPGWMTRIWSEVSTTHTVVDVVTSCASEILLQGKEEVPEGGASILNNMEALFVLALYKEMLTNIAELREHKASVAVISPYKAQVSSIGMQKLFYSREMNQNQIQKQHTYQQVSKPSVLQFAP